MTHTWKNRTPGKKQIRTAIDAFRPLDDARKTEPKRTRRTKREDDSWDGIGETDGEQDGEG